VKSGRALPGRLKVSVVRGDVRQMHQAPENAGALFQVASQFNLLEMVSPRVTPEDGITRYQHDRTPPTDAASFEARSLCSLAPQDDGAVRDRRRRGHDLSQLFRAGRRRRWPDGGTPARRAG
jgi:hypothetical protein